MCIYRKSLAKVKEFHTKKNKSTFTTPISFDVLHSIIHLASHRLAIYGGMLVRSVENLNDSIKLLQSVNKERGRKGKEEKEACRNSQRFQFPNVGNLCHVPINYSGGKHNNNS